MTSPGLDELVSVLVRAAEVAHAAVDAPDVRRSRDDVRADHAVDDAVVPLLAGCGLTVYSEESGRSTPPGTPSRHAVILDPLDGSRNFRLGVPWYAFSACLLRDGRPAAAVVRNLATGATTLGIRGGGAWALTPDGRRRIAVTRVGSLARAHVLYSGYPSVPVPGVTRRNLGASSLDLCAVAAGDFHVSLDLSRSGTESWDHAAGLLIAAEAGAHIRARRTAAGRFGGGVFARRHLAIASSAVLLAEATAWADRAGPAPRG
ncbi:inositol monophosphatase family protein [Krasilnikovia sp. MM14-A1259]|uniref:inositol monophosphatase family protein n=1 Tax=Krasilnikovia sp. MM14-A1259 TaxID=3373539 RepID=UPI003830A235